MNDPLVYYDFDGIVIPAVYVHNDKYLKSLMAEFNLMNSGIIIGGYPIMKVDLEHNYILDKIKDHLKEKYQQYIIEEDLT